MKGLKRLAKGEAYGTFFRNGSICYYGGFPLSFAAATGSGEWWINFLVKKVGADLAAQDASVGWCKLHPSLIGTCFQPLKPGSAYSAFNLNLVV